MDLTSLRDQIAIVGVGHTPQGKVPGRTAASFHAQAVSNALADAGIEKGELDALLLYRHFDPLPGDQDLSAFQVAEQLGISPTVLSQETYCTRSWLHHSVGLLCAGLARFVAVSYGDCARSGRRAFVKELSSGMATDELAAYGDLSTMGKYAMVARRAMDEYGTGPHVWREIAIAQRQWACLNPQAGMYGQPLTDQDYDASPLVTEPLRLLDATPTSDGGRAILLTTARTARTMGVPHVLLRGFGSANKPLSPFRLQPKDPQSAARQAGAAAFAMAGASPQDISACQIYDCFTYTVEATLLDYGFFPPEGTAHFLTRQRIGPGGDLPVNTSGGMLSEGYFMGLTPLSEGVMQLLGRCGQRQLGQLSGTRVPGLMLCSDNGGVFQSHLTMILERGR